MDTARYLADNSTPDALTVAGWIADRPSRRVEFKAAAGNLICRDCAQPAWFISARSSGQGPSFGSHHAEDCDRASNRGPSVPGHLDPAAPELVNDYSSLALRHTALGQTNPGGAVREAAANEDAQDRTGRSHSATIGLDSTRYKHSELREVLQGLATDPDWIANQGELRVEMPERGSPLLRDVIWSMADFDSANEAMMGKQIIAWGKVRTVNPDNRGSVYFNQDVHPNSKGAIVLSSADCDEIVTQYARRGITSIHDFQHWYIAVVGRSYHMFNGRVGLTAAMPEIAFYRPRPTT